ncbi:MAG: rod shape-determining protein [Planctomycetes bacterium]|nr:rod shape-determining protein [Planctomycetota bacterium]
MSESSGILYVGLDLGTSRTSIAASNGQRATLLSYVGYPKDVVSRKLLQRDVLVGQDAVDRRLALDLYRPLAAGVIQAEGPLGEKNLRAAHDLIAEIVRRAKPQPGDLVYAVIGAPAQASMQNKRAILEAARDSVDSVILCSEPFAVAYGVDMLDDALVIDIGAGTTDLCRMRGTMPEDADQITNTFAGDYVDERLIEEIRAFAPRAQFSKEMIKAIKERHSNVSRNAPLVVVDLPVEGKPLPFDLTDPIRNACKSIVPPIVDGLAQLIASFDPEFQPRLKQRVLLAGGGSQIKGLDRAIEEEMRARLGEGRVVLVEEPLYAGASGALKLAEETPAEFWEKLK